MATDPPADTVVFHIALLCCSTSSYLVKLPAPHSSPGTTTQKKKKVFCSHMSDYPVPVSAKRRHCLQRQSKAEKTFFHHHSPSLLSGAGVNAENKLVRSTCARLAALSWCHQGPHVRISQMPLRLKFFHFWDGKSCRRGGEKLLYRWNWPFSLFSFQKSSVLISWINSTKHSFWIVSRSMVTWETFMNWFVTKKTVCKGSSTDHVLWICRCPRSPVVFCLWQLDWSSTFLVSFA